jgi:hypothetical protein
MQHHVARQYAWCKTGVPAPNAAEVKALLYDLDEARARAKCAERDVAALRPAATRAWEMATELDVVCGKLGEMAKVIDEAIAHYRRYDELDGQWLSETARRLRELAGDESERYRRPIGEYEGGALDAAP